MNLAKKLTKNNNNNNNKKQTNKQRNNNNKNPTKVMVFRKGDHLGGYQQEVVNSYTYLGNIFTTKLSVKKGPERIAVLGKRKVIDTIRVLWSIECTCYFSTYLARMFNRLFIYL